MSFKTTYYCDGCGVAKNETNHWVSASRGVRDWLTIVPFNSERPEHYCGAECAMKAVGMFIASLQKGH